MFCFFVSHYNVRPLIVNVNYSMVAVNENNMNNQLTNHANGYTLHTKTCKRCMLFMEAYTMRTEITPDQAADI